MEDNQHTFCQTIYPFRPQSTGLALIAEVIVKAILGIIVYGGIPTGLIMLIIPLLGILNGELMGLLLACVWAAAFTIALSKKIVTCYDKSHRTFSYEKYLFGRVTKRFVWPANLFQGISYGNHGVPYGRASGVRLHTGNDMYVLGFMYGNNSEESRAIAKKLSEYSAVTMLGKISTGKQHALDDLKESPAGVKYRSV